MAKQLLLGAQPFTARMFAKAPLDGWRLWLDVVVGEPDRIYIAEAPAGTLPTAAAFRGIRLRLVGDGIAGPVEVAENFVWDNRATAVWT